MTYVRILCMKFIGVGSPRMEVRVCVGVLKHHFEEVQ